MDTSIAKLGCIGRTERLRRVFRLSAAIATSLLLVIVATPPSLARGHEHGHVFLGFDFFVPPYPYYYPPPAYYYPPPPAYYYAPPDYSAPPPPQNCRKFNGDASIDASGAPFYGTACLQADGRWH